MSCFEAAFGFASVARSESQHACGRVRERPRGHRDGGTRRGPVLEPWGHTWGTGSQKRDARPQQTPVLELGCHRTAVARPPREGCAAMPACGGPWRGAASLSAGPRRARGTILQSQPGPPGWGVTPRGLQRLPVSPPPLSLAGGHHAVSCRCRAHHADRGDHQARGGHRGEGGQAAPDHRGHPGLR